MGQGSALTPLSLNVVSYGLAATGFLLLTVLLLTSWQGRAQGGRLIVACVVTMVWAAYLALGSDRDAVRVDARNAARSSSDTAPGSSC